MTKEAMKLALEALEYIEHNYMSLPAPAEKAITALREALAEQPAQQDSTCSNALRAQGKAYPRTCKKCGLGLCVELAQQALDKKAENARELGLDYEPAQQAPVLETVYKTIIRWDEGGGKRSRRELARRIVALYTATQPEQEPVAFYVYKWINPSDGTVFRSFRPDERHMGQGPGRVISVPPQRTWVGLSTEDMATCIDEPAWDLILRKAEQILKEKNT